MKALVTGATGFIGSHLVEHLVKDGQDVRCFVRSTSNTRWLENLPVEIFVGDFFDLDTLKKALQNVHAVYHVAGVTKAQKKRDYWRVNAEATRRLLEAAVRRAGSIERFVHVSSQAAVGPSLNGTPVDESTPLHPIDIYGRSKKGAEEACLEYSSRLPITVIRPVAVYGPRDKDTFFFFKSIHQGILPIFGSQDKRVALVHARDLAEGILIAARKDQAVGETYFIGNELSPSWGDLLSVARGIAEKKVRKVVMPNFSIYLVAAFAEPLSLITGKPALFTLEKAREIAQPDWSCDVRKAKMELGFEARTPLVEGMRETFLWYRAEGWLN